MKTMKGIILAGGKGVRLQPLTKVMSKALLTVYNEPLIMYPLKTLLKAGIKDILIIVPPGRIEDFMNLLGTGEDIGVKFSYKIQKEPNGMSGAVMLGEDFVGEDNVAVICADNVFDEDFSKAVTSFKSGCKIFVKEVVDPERLGVVKYNKEGKAIDLIEKPKKFVSNHGITGFYIYDYRVFKVANSLKPSDRGELEITDLHRWFLNKGEMEIEMVKNKWIDAGTFDSLLEANIFIARKEGSKLAERCEIEI